MREAVGGPTGGHWHIQIERPGTYEFTLRRWPEQTKAALGAAYPPSPKSPSNKPKIVTRSFPQITQGRLQIAGHDLTAQADAAATHCTLTTELKEPGRTTLKAWFTDKAGDGQCGAFFVTVRRTSEIR